MKGLRNVDANKFSLRSQKHGDVHKGPAGSQSRRLVSRKENENPAKRTAKPKLAPAKASVPVAAAESASLMEKYAKVGDVDDQANERSDCLLVACYVKDIFTYLRQLELTAGAIRPDFLRRPAKLEITPRMRTILLDWLVLVHQRFTLQPETLYLTYHIVDAYMSSDAGPAVKKKQYQLIGVAAMLLASKYEEIYPPNVMDFVYVTDSAYTDSDVRSMERRLLAQLDYFLGYPLPIQFLRRYSKVAAAPPAVHEAAKYLAELARADYAAAHLPPSALAAAAFCLARRLLPTAAVASASATASSAAAAPAATAADDWSDALEVFSGYSRSQLEPAVRLVAGTAVRAAESVKYTAIRKKYSNPGASMAATWPELSGTGPALRAAAAGGTAVQS